MAYEIEYDHDIETDEPDEIVYEDFGEYDD